MSTIDITKLSAAQLVKLARDAAKKEKAEKSEARKKYDALRDDYLEKVFIRMADLSKRMKELKANSVRLGIELHAKMYEAYGREIKEGIDNYTLTSGDGLRKVLIERSHVCAYDESVEVGIGLIRDVLRDKFGARSKEAYRTIEALMVKNRAGDYDENMVAKLRSIADTYSGDDRFTKGLDIIAKSYKPYRSQMYMRAYQKDEVGKWKEVVMNWSAM